MSERLVEWNHFDADALNGKLESEARKLWCGFSRVVKGSGSGAAGGNVSIEVMPAFNRVGYAAPADVISTPTGSNCIASTCAHWCWLHRGGTRYERHSFQSELPVPEGAKPPADVPEGWEFESWDANVLGLKKNGHQPLTPRFWARRAVEVILPRGLCGLAGQS